MIKISEATDVNLCECYNNDILPGLNPPTTACTHLSGDDCERQPCVRHPVTGLIRVDGRDCTSRLRSPQCGVATVRGRTRHAEPHEKEQDNYFIGRHTHMLGYVKVYKTDIFPRGVRKQSHPTLQLPKADFKGTPAEIDLFSSGALLFCASGSTVLPVVCRS